MYCPHALSTVGVYTLELGASSAHTAQKKRDPKDLYKRQSVPAMLQFPLSEGIPGTQDFEEEEVEGGLWKAYMD